MWTNFEYLCAENDVKWDYLLRLVSAEKSKVLGSPKIWENWILKMIVFCVFGNWFITRKVWGFLSIPHRLWRRNHESYRNIIIIKINISENKKNTKSLCLERTKNHRFLVQKWEKWADMVHLRAENVSEDNVRNHRKLTRNARLEDHYL